ncbi:MULTISPECIES: inovirus Gp2 family protein [unclassified Enterobacter]|uniref:inovirus Gp2 family protein n=1 Tax=unclassified Enterobacter TaxID=2608935 RepID=UPI0015C838FD|nr:MULTISPECIES: inovirus Gp2 family protein [unclassified Enterobacter]MBB3303903.1 hypothetical protein [Enterobacter sp. Sphag1F]NYI12992.1 hypothetical protein [Enterobacter sp. Sphag71]
MPNYNPLYVNGVERTLNTATSQHARLSTFRVDLHFPLDRTGRRDELVISRFFDSLKYHLSALIERKRNDGLTCHNRTAMHYIWCREYGPVNGNRHYHVMLMLNKDVFCFLGNLQLLPDQYSSLANLIQRAWCSALKLRVECYAHLAHFPDCAVTWIERNSPHFSEQMKIVRYRAMYLAKTASKQIGNGRSFGSSQPSPSLIG